jgi:hypothetical protein
MLQSYAIDVTSQKDVFDTVVTGFLHLTQHLAEFIVSKLT